MITIWGTVESNYYQGRRSYRAVGKIAKKVAEAGINNYDKAFVRPHLDHDNIVYDEAYNETLHQ